MAKMQLVVLFLVCLVLFLTSCQLDTSNSDSLPDRSMGTSASAEAVLERIETDLLSAGFSQSDVDTIKARSRNNLETKGLTSSADISEFGPELLRGALEGAKELDDADSRVQAIEILTNCLIVSSESVVTASRAGPRTAAFAPEPLFSSTDYASLISTLTAIFFSYLDEIGLDTTEINTVVTTLTESIVGNLKDAGISDEDIPSVTQAITQGAVASLDEMGKTDSEFAAAIDAITSGAFQGLEEMGYDTTAIGTMADEITAGAVAGLEDAGVDDGNIDTLIDAIKDSVNDGLEEAGLTATEIAEVQDAIADAADEGKTSLPLKTITAFSFKATDNTALSADVTATFSGTSITATVPYGTDVTSLVATFTIIGESIKIGGTTQVSGTTANDFSSAVTYTVTATDSLTQDFSVTVSIGARPAGDTDTYTAGSVSFTMIYVPGGLTFFTGIDDDNTAVVVNNYLIGQTPVTYELWYAVRNWASSNGYTFANNGQEGTSGTPGAAPTTADQEPATYMNWRDAMVWANALTEYYNAENGTALIPVYSYGGSIVRNSTSTDCDDVVASTTAKGFRLLTSNEWDLAARYIDDANNDGDILDSGEYYPSDHASGADAPIGTTTGDSDLDGDGEVEYTDAVADFSAATTTDVGSLRPNNLGIYDMSGNVWECLFNKIVANRSLRGAPHSSTGDYRKLGYTAEIGPTTVWTNTGLRLGKSL